MALGIGFLALGLFLLWCIAWLAGTFFFRFGKNGSLKRTWHPRYVIAMAVCFCLLFVVPLPDWNPGEAKGESTWDTGEILSAFIFGPLIAFGAWRSIRITRFCGACGALNKRRFRDSGKCRRCGVPL